jgi:PmbA protein
LELLDLAADVVARAGARGASDAECVVREGAEFSVRVRLGEVEQIKEAGSKAMGLRVLQGKRAASAYTSDFSAAGVEKLLASALEIVPHTSEDPFAGLPEAGEFGFGADPASLNLYDDSILGLSSEEKIDMVRRAEQAALETDPRISNSDGASFGSGWGCWVLANSRGFSGEYRSSSCSLSVSPLAEDAGSKERDYWYTVGRSPAVLEAPERVGRIAAERALRRLHPTKVATTKVPIIFEPRIARSLLGHILSAVSGDAIYRQASFLAGQLGQQVAAPNITIVDDGLRPGGFGSSPFDDEGVATRRTTVLREGVLESYLLNSYTARKLGLKTTGNASRGLAGNPGVGPGNFMLSPGEVSPEEIIRSVKNGFYVTELMGFGVNLVTGDYSRGAAGFWIENGEIGFPVSEVTIAGNLKQMLLDVEMIGSDLDFQSSVIVPTIKIREMIVAGK